MKSYSHGAAIAFSSVRRRDVRSAAARLLAAAAAIGATSAAWAAPKAKASKATPAPPVQLRTVFLERSALPLTQFQLTFRVGSADDPPGKQGLAQLTATMLREGGSKAMGMRPSMSRAELEETLFPLAAEIHVDVEAEQTTLSVTAPVEEAERVLDVLAQVTIAPAFDAKEFERVKSETLLALKNRWPQEDAEEIGKAVLDAAIFGKGHPYAHVRDGTVKTVAALTLDDVKKFYATKYTLRRLTAGLAGNVSERVRRRFEQHLRRLPPGEDGAAAVPAAPTSQALSLTLVKGPFESVGVHLGVPLSVTRASPEFPAWYLVATAFGKHRSFVGRLMRVVREERGLNYGAYAYVEAFPDGGRRLTEPTQAARQRQAFTLWGRPTSVDNGCFLLKQMYREMVRLANEGLSEEEFALAKSHLLGTLPMMGAELDRALGYRIDAVFYGLDEEDPTMRLVNGVKALEHRKVNQLLREQLKPFQAKLVVTTPDPARFKRELAQPACAIRYPEGIQKSSRVKQEDDAIASFVLNPAEVVEIDAVAFFTGE
jgi:zinc protease